MPGWTKKGLVFATARDGVGGWMRHSALTPTPYRLDEERIRVYAGFRDDEGTSRIGYVDVLARDPTRVLDFSREPALDAEGGHVAVAIVLEVLAGDLRELARADED
jgi:hypothetical protein